MSSTLQYACGVGRQQQLETRLLAYIIAANPFPSKHWAAYLCLACWFPYCSCCNITLKLITPWELAKEGLVCARYALCGLLTSLCSCYLKSISDVYHILSHTHWLGSLCYGGLVLVSVTMYQWFVPCCSATAWGVVVTVNTRMNPARHALTEWIFNE